ncbi:MAG: Fur family transcriptional regulator [Geminicoccaceae bacterium]
MNAALAALATRPHDHARCIDQAISRAEALCKARGERFTELRKRVLQIIWHGHKPVGAYEIMHALTRERGRVAPPTVYRALDFLVAQGLVHRVHSLNAFVGCPLAEHDHVAQLFICERCGCTAELASSALDTALDDLARDIGFCIEHRTIEIAGVCDRCQATSR